MAALTASNVLASAYFTLALVPNWTKGTLGFQLAPVEQKNKKENVVKTTTKGSKKEEREAG